MNNIKLGSEQSSALIETLRNGMTDLEEDWLLSGNTEAGHKYRLLLAVLTGVEWLMNKEGEVSIVLRT